MHTQVMRRKQPDADPLEALIDLVDDPDGPDDVAVNHDHYLYGAAKDESCGSSTPPVGPLRGPHSSGGPCL